MKSLFKGDCDDDIWTCTVHFKETVPLIYFTECLDEFLNRCKLHGPLGGVFVPVMKWNVKCFEFGNVWEHVY